MQGATAVDKFRVAIVGAGPAGMSAAARAAELDRQAGRATPSYVLLDGFGAHAKTIQRYQKGKAVMAEPGFLDLRSDMHFAAGTREQVLQSWQEDLRRLHVNLRTNAEVAGISGAQGAFVLRLAGGETLCAENVVLAIGLEGNPRPVGAPGDQLPGVQYQLDDPDEYREETILVVGAGDSAIENALALAGHNDVWILNRGKEFNRAKDANLSAVLAAIADPDRRLGCHYETTIRRIVRDESATPPLSVDLQTATGEQNIRCHRIIARLGAIAPRRFVESIGIRFPNDRPDSIPELSRRYESNVPGVYVIGSLAGYPLIKQAMNQGYEVIEFIHGRDIKPADEPLLENRFAGLPYGLSVDEALARFQRLIPMFRQLNALAFRELLVESEMVVAYAPGPEYEEVVARIAALEQRLAGVQPGRARVTRIMREGEDIYRPGEFGTSFYTILQGEVTLHLAGAEAAPVKLGRGEFFGESSLLSGRPRVEHAVAGPGCVLVETPRRTMLKLMSSNEEVRSGIDWIFVVRELERHFAPGAAYRELRDVAGRVTVRKFRAGETIFEEGAAGNSLFVLRSGGVTLSRAPMQGSGHIRRRADRGAVISQVRAGQLFGEMALMGDSTRRETAVAAVASEVIEIRGREFLELTGRPDARIAGLQESVSRHGVDGARMQVRPEAGSAMNFLMREGLGEATNVMVIDEALCVGCDNCEKACAETHGGVSRLQREAGASHAQLHIPIACRHCEQPHCMKDCPPNAIRRSPDGAVFIEDSCIGCGNCESNCPYGAIHMAYPAPPRPGLLSWLLFGRGPGPGEAPGVEPHGELKAAGKKAVKCDACIGRASGPACVSACPTGAAIRIGPDRFVDLVEERRS